MYNLVIYFGKRSVINHILSDSNTISTIFVVDVFLGRSLQRIKVLRIIVFDAFQESQIIQKLLHLFSIQKMIRFRHYIFLATCDAQGKRYYK